jgi:hypothetical protein
MASDGDCACGEEVTTSLPAPLVRALEDLQARGLLAFRAEGEVIQEGLTLKRWRTPVQPIASNVPERTTIIASLADGSFRLRMVARDGVPPEFDLMVDNAKTDQPDWLRRLGQKAFEMAPACTPLGHFYETGKARCVCGDAMLMAAQLERRIVTRCPSCGSQSLFLGSGGHLTCAVIGCKEPGVERAIEALRVAAKQPKSAPKGTAITTALDLYCAFAGWQGGTIHQAIQDFRKRPPLEQGIFIGKLTGHYLDVRDFVDAATEAAKGE